MIEGFARAALWLALIAVFLAASPGPGYKFGGFPLALMVPFLLGGLLFAVIAVLASLSGFGLRVFAASGSMMTSTVALVLAGAVIFYVGSFVAGARAVPAIHDITTDTDNPPEFVAVLPLRGEGVSPASYDGNDPVPGNPEQTVREAQLAHYTDLGPLFLDTDFNFAFTAVIATVEELGWELVEASSEDGRIEAIVSTWWYGFKDDVVIRVAAQSDGTTRVDVRSKSRVGISDIGANAARIQTFLDALSAKTGG